MVYVFFAHGFEEIEAVTVVDILRRADIEVQTVGIGAKTVTGSHGITVHCDIADKQAGLKNLEMIVLPGGMPGTVNLEKSPVIQQFITAAFEKDIWLAAICAAPSILANRKLLDKRTFTCFPGCENGVEDGNCTGNRVEQDGKLITGKGPGAAMEFALKLVEVLTEEGHARAVKDKLQ